MKYLLIPDKFKGSLSSQEVIEALMRGIHNADPNAEIYKAIVSDGGDGFVDSVAENTNAAEVICKSVDPLSRPINAAYLLDRKTNSAYIEMARTAGLELLNEAERNPLYTSTLGTGIQIRDAIEKGARTIYIGLGGSATNDAGMGIAEAMGYQFLDSHQKKLQPIGDNLGRVSKIVKPDRIFDSEVKFYAINDVDNPLFGPEGAAFTYAEQKGADQQQIRDLDEGLKQLDKVVLRDLGPTAADAAGAGAAGGTAYGLMNFLNAEFISGTGFMLELAGIPEILDSKDLDLIITGEGKIDSQTLRGKLIYGILKLGLEHSIPVIAVCGALDADEGNLVQQGLHKVIEVRDRSKTLAYNMENADILVEKSISSYLSKNV